MAELRGGVRFVQRITAIDISEFNDFSAYADARKVARNFHEVGIMAAIVDAANGSKS
jgi:hypothetical protein